VRKACAGVAACARWVRIDPERLAAYAEEIPAAGLRSEDAGAAWPLELDAEGRAGFVLCLDAVNFGSGWFPHLSKRPGLSGYRTIEASLADHLRGQGPLTTAALCRMDAPACARLFGQQGAPEPIHELMELFARAWRDLGELLVTRYEGRFLALVRAAERSAASLVRRLCAMPLYRDVACYAGTAVPFLKRAQITAQDLAHALDDEPAFEDLDELTLFADNLVPHVLRLDGVLRFDAALEARIGREELIPSGSAEEVEMRACAVHAVEELAGRLAARHPGVRPRHVDLWLWQRGAGTAYKARPRHRTRCPYY
jgi:hypothetical protein